MKFTIVTIVLGVFIFSGCSGKYQTNKLPDEKSVHVPDGYEKSKYYLYEKPKEKYKKYVIQEFNHGFDERNFENSNSKKNRTENKSKINRNDLWYKGYELDRKRY